MTKQKRFHASAGIAIGPILFVIAMLAVLAAAMSSGGGDYQVASGADRITNDIVAQANLIRNTINDCNMQYTLAVSSNSVTPTGNPYPLSDTSNGTAVKSLVCDPMGTGTLWGAILMPPPTGGFSPWTYINAYASGGGRCFWTAPTASNPINSQSTVTGLVRAAQKFNSSAAYSATTEVIYDKASTSQKFVVWITLPTGTPDSHCVP